MSDPVGDRRKCWIAYKKWMMAICMATSKAPNCYAINYHAIKKKREEREMEE